MELTEMKVKQNHVIKKIREISESIDRGELWIMILMVSLLGSVVGSLLYYYL